MAKLARFSVRILVMRERCHVIGEYFESLHVTVVIGYRTLAGEFCVVNGEFSDLRCLMNNLSTAFKCNLFNSFLMIRANCISGLKVLVRNRKNRKHFFSDTTLNWFCT